jgi:tetratricopeptide (TPR) repeat protein
VAGFLLSVPVGMIGAAHPSFMALVIGLPMAAATVVLLHGWVNDGPMPALLPAIGAIVLLVNLLAAGALSIPAVAGTLWLLLALGLNRVGHGREVHVGQPGAFALLAATLGLVVACYLTGYGAVVPSQGFARRAADDPLRAEQYWREARAADPLDCEPWLQMSGIAFARWQFSKDAASFDEFEQCAEACYARAPQMPASRAMTAKRYLAAADLAKRNDYLQKGIAAYREAAERYPTNASYHAALALALRRAGEEVAFIEHAQTALRLDEITPHKDRKLPDELRNSLRRSISERK